MVKVKLWVKVIFWSRSRQRSNQGYVIVMVKVMVNAR